MKTQHTPLSNKVSTPVSLPDPNLFTIERFKRTATKFSYRVLYDGMPICSIYHNLKRDAVMAMRRASTMPMPSVLPNIETYELAKRLYEANSVEEYEAIKAEHSPHTPTEPAATPTEPANVIDHLRNMFESSAVGCASDSQVEAQKIMYARHGEWVVVKELTDSEKLIYGDLRVGGLYKIDHCYAADSDSLYLSDCGVIVGRVRSEAVVVAGLAVIAIERAKRGNLKIKFTTQNIKLIQPTEGGVESEGIVERICRNGDVLLALNHVKVRVPSLLFIERIEKGLYRMVE